MQRIGVSYTKGQKDDVTKVYDESGFVKGGEEAVGLWKRHFERVLNGDEVGEDSEELREAVAVDPGKMLESSAGPQRVETEVSPGKGWSDSRDDVL